MSVFWRLALSLALGALVGVYIGMPLVDSAISLAVFILPPVLSVALDGAIVRKRAAVLWVVGVLVGGCVLLSVGDLLLNVLQGYQKFDSDLFIYTAILAIPGSAVFALGSRGTRFGGTIGLGLGCGALAWLGVGLHNLLIPYLLGYYSDRGPAGGMGSLVFVVLVMLYVLLGFGLALLLAALGVALRVWVAREFGSGK
ncbi:MAG: hypothetical protein OJF49_002698 [Ktedonobacterales bacterium]|jgi:hypothetical protein|nr:MAG: hypothetical protein OJF49_002698 [Ktedonobacterales bacterium]